VLSYRTKIVGSFALAGLSTAVLLGLVVLPAVAKVPGRNGRIVFATFRPGKTSGDTPLFTANPDGSVIRNLSTRSSCCAAWSPDGKRIAISGLTPDGRITTELVDPDGSHAVVEPIRDSTLNLGCSAWSPDGSRMLCSGWDDKHKNRPRGLFSVRVSDWGDLKQLTKNPYGMNDDPGDYSPDGKRILFIREMGQNRNALYTASADGTSVKPVPTGSLVPDCCAASWSPDGKWILFSAVGSIQVAHPDGSDMQAITLKARCLRSSGHPVLAGVSVYQLRCHNGRYITDPNVLDWVAFQPSWSPDGKKIVFSLFVGTSAAAGKRGVFTANANGTDVTALTRPVGEQTRSLDFPGSTDWGPTTR
jgi:Tol biopolymer transport system component